MSCRGFSGGPRAGIPAVPSIGACGWDEQFDESSIAELMAKYPAPSFGNSWNYNLAPGVDTDYLELSGGRLLIHGLGNGSTYGFIISPGVLPFPTGVWYRIQCEMIGGDYDAPLETDPYLFDINVHTAADKIVALTGAPLSVNPIDLPARSGNLWLLYANAPAPPDPNLITAYSAISDVMPVGAHEFIMYMSTSASGELWYDASAGDAPDASITEPAYADGFRFHQTQINGPAGAGLALAIGRIQIACGSRSSDPFGIL